jgi:opine dehydrogenase
MARVTVLGGGAGGHAVAAEAVWAGHAVTLAELPEFAGALAPLHATRTIEVLGRGSEPMAAKLDAISSDVGDAVRGADLIFIVAPCFGHEPMSQAAAPHLRHGQSIVFLGEGSGALVLRKVLREAGIRRDLLVGETNSLPYAARLRGPGRVQATRKRGGTLLAALPGRRTAELISRVKPLWPAMAPATNVLETILVNFNAIDHVPAVVCNAGTLETRTTPCLLWGEGASPSVARVIEAVDDEILAIRAALGFADRTPYRDFLVAQGLLDAPRPTTYDALRNSALAASVFHCGPQALQFRYITEDVPYALVLASSIGAEIGVDTPVIDGLIAIASAMLGRAFRDEGRTLATLGLAGGGVDGLRRFAATGELQPERLPA